MTQQVWYQWQQQVVNKIRRDYEQVLAGITLDDVDWNEWRSLYEQGRTPSDAVDYAFVRVTRDDVEEGGRR
jgi:hypothetical protein